MGEFELTTPPAATIDELIMLNGCWVHPVRWRNLNSVEVQLRSDEALGARIAFTEGVSNIAGRPRKRRLTLYNSAASSLAGSGPIGKKR